MAIDLCRVNYQKSWMEIRRMKKKMNQYYNHNQSRPEVTYHRIKKGKIARRWDAILVGVVFSVAFLLLLTKISQITPCEALSDFNIDTRTCGLIANTDTIEGQIASQHG